MNEQLKQSAKDEAAREYGFDEYERLLELPCSEHEGVINRAMEIYAERVNEKSLKLLERASNLVGSPLTGVSGSTDLACDRWQNDYLQFKTTKP